MKMMKSEIFNYTFWYLRALTEKSKKICCLVKGFTTKGTKEIADVDGRDLETVSVLPPGAVSGATT